MDVVGNSYWNVIVFFIGKITVLKDLGLLQLAVFA